MTPAQFQLFLDIVTLILGVVSAVALYRASLGGTVRSAANLILIGIIVLAANHLLATVWLEQALVAAGHTSDYLQPEVVHRSINLVGFIFMTFGFLKFKKLT